MLVASDLCSRFVSAVDLEAVEPVVVEVLLMILQVGCFQLAYSLFLFIE